MSDREEEQRDASPGQLAHAHTDRDRTGRAVPLSGIVAPAIGGGRGDRRGAVPSSPLDIGLKPSAQQRAASLSRSRQQNRGPPSPSGLLASADDFLVAEEEGDLGLSGLHAIRAVHRVGLDVLGEFRADGAGGGFLGIGRPHHLAVAGDGVFTF
jgi:hypothetical protein